MPLTREKLRAYLVSRGACDEGLAYFDRLGGESAGELWDACDHGFFLDWLIHTALGAGAPAADIAAYDVELCSLYSRFRKLSRVRSVFSFCRPLRPRAAEAVKAWADAIKQHLTFEQVERWVLVACGRRGI